MKNMKKITDQYGNLFIYDNDNLTKINNSINIFTFNHQDRKIKKTKTPFLNNYLYEIKNLSKWIKFKNISFRWEEVLYFLEIPYKKFDLFYIANEIQKKENFKNYNDFLNLLIKINCFFHYRNEKKELSFYEWKYKN
jgi:hypothetical protein